MSALAAGSRADVALRCGWRVVAAQAAADGSGSDVAVHDVWAHDAPPPDPASLQQGASPAAFTQLRHIAVLDTPRAPSASASAKSRTSAAQPAAARMTTAYLAFPIPHATPLLLAVASPVAEHGRACVRLVTAAPAESPDSANEVVLAHPSHSHADDTVAPLLPQLWDQIWAGLLRSEPCNHLAAASAAPAAGGGSRDFSAQAGSCSAIDADVRADSSAVASASGAANASAGCAPDAASADGGVQAHAAALPHSVPIWEAPDEHELAAATVWQPFGARVASYRMRLYIKETFEIKESAKAIDVEQRVPSLHSLLAGVLRAAPPNFKHQPTGS